MKENNNPLLNFIRRFILIFLGAALMAFNINTFVQAGGLIPGGFTGLSLLFQRIVLQYFNFKIPFSALYFTLNAVPAIICFKFVGKKFTLYSILMVIMSGLMTDFMPKFFINLIQLNDTLLSAVFGGIIYGIAVILCLCADATSGGTDFIAIFISEKYRKDAWNYIFAGNCVILVASAALFSLEKALYSIIYQFSATLVLNNLYRAYQQKTMFIVTSHPTEVYNVIYEKTNHAATCFSGVGMFNKAEKNLLYSVVYSNEITPVINAVRAIDPDAFINIIKTEQLNGRFFKKPKE